MSEIRVGDFIRISTEDESMAYWAKEMAQAGDILEVLELRRETYWSKHPNGEEYGIAHHHAIPVKTDLISQIKQESKRF